MAKNEDDQLWSMESKLTITRRTISSLHNCKLRSQWWRTDTSLYFLQMIPMKYLHCYFDPMFARWRRINSRVDWQQAIRMRMKRSGRSWNLLTIFLEQFSLMGSRSTTTTSIWRCLLLIWSSALGSTWTGEQRTKRNGRSGWAWGLSWSVREYCEGTMFGDLIVENKLQRQTEDFSNIIISTKYQYSSEVGQEGGVMIDDNAGVSWWCQRVPIMIRNTFYFDENARSPRFSPSGTWLSTTTSVGLRSVLTPSGWSLAMSWVLEKRLKALPSTILTQWTSEYWSF